MLPIDSKGNPNYAFMKSFMKNLEQKHLRKIIKYYENKLLDSNGGGGDNICHPPYLTESSLCYTNSISCHTDFLSRHTDLLPCHTEQSEVSQRHNEQSHTFTTKQNLATFLEGSLMEIAKNELSLKSVQWGEFKVSDLFERIEKGKCKNFNQETKISKNGVSFLSATINNNGVSAFVEKNSLLQKGNCIMFVNQGDGGAGYAAYKREDFVATTSCSFGYADWVNKYTGLFVASILCRFKEKYSFGYGRTEARLKNDVVMLPIDSKGNPHYEFMESFMKNLEQKHLQKILAYYTHKLNSSGGGGG